MCLVQLLRDVGDDIIVSVSLEKIKFLLKFFIRGAEKGENYPNPPATRVPAVLVVVWSLGWVVREEVLSLSAPPGGWLHRTSDIFAVTGAALFLCGPIPFPCLCRSLSKERHIFRARHVVGDTDEADVVEFCQQFHIVCHNTSFTTLFEYTTKLEKMQK
jgi:hypothetical protein